MAFVKVSSGSRKAKFGKDETNSVLGERLHCKAQIALVVYLLTRHLADFHVSDVTLFELYLIKSLPLEYHVVHQ